MNFANDFSRRFDYEKITLNDICLFTLQNKLQNIAIIVIQIINIDVNEIIDEKKMTTTSFLCQTKQKSNFSNNYYVKKRKKNVREKKRL